jgi:hypothetical protein
MIKGSVLLVVAVYSLMPAGSASAQIFTLSGGVIRAGSSEFDDSPGTGLVIGGYFSAPLANQFSYELGITYAQRFIGKFAFQTLNPDGTVSVIEQQQRLDYIEIPILLRVNFRADARISPHLVLGPAVGLYVNCSVTQTESVFESGFFLGSIETPLPCGSPSGVQLDARAGLGMDVEVSSGLTAVADVAYSLGLTTIYPDSPGKSRALIISVGVGFRIG